MELATQDQLGKNRVVINRELVASKRKAITFINVEYIIASERIVALYEHGKNRVKSNRELAAAKLLTIDNRVANVAALSDFKASVSEIAGQRLYVQAQQSAKKKSEIRKIARTAPLPQMELATQEGSFKKPIDWGTSPTERFLSLYEQGKIRVTTDRELEIKISEGKADLHDENIIAEYANMRQIKLYEMGKKRLLDEKLNSNQENVCNKKVLIGHANARQIKLYEKGKQKLLNKRLIEKQQIDNINDYIVSSQLCTVTDANARMIKLYEMSKEMQEDGKARREEIICGKEDMNKDTLMSSSQSKNIAPNATMKKLYAMSKLMQEDGKERRDEILHSKIGFPDMKV